jgi:arylsulfatase
LRQGTLAKLFPRFQANVAAALYNLTMDPYEKYDMFFNGAVATRATTTSPGRYAGMDNGWAVGVLQPVIVEFDKSIVDFPSIKRVPGGSRQINLGAAYARSAWPLCDHNPRPTRLGVLD